LLARKANSKFRLCADYRLLNAITVEYVYLMQNVENILSELAKCQIYLKIDLRDLYYHISVAEESEDSTSFVCPFGTYCFRVMPFGSKNAPSIFQRAIEAIVIKFHKENVFGYLDNIIIGSKNLKDHVDTLTRLISRLTRLGIHGSRDKYEFFLSEVNFRGQVVETKGIRCSENKSNTLKNHGLPEGKKSLQTSLRLTNYVKKYIQGYADKVAPLC
jgi:Reverse transcriptase (RNA-dependent DNA polymerase)